MPSVSFLSGWLLEGICRDPCDEFAVRQLSATATDETFWTSAYQQVPAGTDNDHPSFLQVYTDHPSLLQVSPRLAGRLASGP